MKILNVNPITRSYLLIIICLFITAAGCGKSASPKIKSQKVDNPAETSTTCAQNTGLEEQDSETLAKALKNYGGKISDEFKLRAMAIISESDSVNPEDANDVLKNYFSCLENYAAK
ncbi:MAG: hypothetical protein RIG61_11445 [Deltaproteobacteria bacterium]